METKRYSPLCSAALAALCCILLTAVLLGGAAFVFPGAFTKKAPDLSGARGDRSDPAAPVKKGEGSADRTSASLLGRMLADGREISGVYVATVWNLNYPEKQGMSDEELIAELDGVISVCRKAKLNTVVFQVRPMADAFYRSKIFPSSAFITGTQGQAPGIDVLDELILRAHANDIAVVAWVNPLRAAKGGLDGLSPANPAAIHPEYTAAYGGTVWFDPGLPEVRELVARGCAEIAANYEVDGILFDDYFYPYPKDGESFDDAASYVRYGGGASLADWRRENVNSLVRESYEAVKAADPDCLFGIAPFGIWANDDGVNGGSDTRGLDAYSEIYCDALAWVKGGYVDFLAPQIYWDLGHRSAPYATVARWWADKLADTGVALLSSNAAYKIAEWSDPGELSNQVAFDRECGGYSGCLFYSYAAFKDDLNGVVDAMADLFSADGK